MPAVETPARLSDCKTSKSASFARIPARSASTRGTSEAEAAGKTSVSVEPSSISRSIMLEGVAAGRAAARAEGAAAFFPRSRLIRCIGTFSLPLRSSSLRSCVDESYDLASAMQLTPASTRRGKRASSPNPRRVERNSSCVPSRECTSAATTGLSTAPPGAEETAARHGIGRRGAGCFGALARAWKAATLLATERRCAASCFQVAQAAANPGFGNVAGASG